MRGRKWLRKIKMKFSMDSTDPQNHTLIEEDKSEKPHSREKFNSGLYKINMVDDDYIPSTNVSGVLRYLRQGL